MNHPSLRFLLLFVMVLFLVLGSGCGQSAEPAPEVQPTELPTVAGASGGEGVPDVLVTARPLSIPPTNGGAAVAGAAALPAEPQPVSFMASDGIALNGIYYPAAVNPAPIIVLMHWAGGNMHDWDAVAPWLQNRGLTGPAETAFPWLDSSWFPTLAEGQTYAVFVFNFRGFDAGEIVFNPEGWLMDAQAAIATARTLEGVDPQRIIAIGASIGADGAPDACAEGCLGSLSLSPGSYLGVTYVQAVEALVNAEPAREVWCLAGELDPESAPACQSADALQNEHVFVQMYPGNDHGMFLIQPDVVPSAMQYILDFINLVLGN